MFRAPLLLLIALATAGAQEWYSTHRVSAGFSGYIPAAGPGISDFDTAPALTFDYGYRFHRYGQFDAGVDTAWTSPGTRDRMLYIPRAGYRVILPLWRDRIEASLGFGGGYAFYKPTIATNEMWLVYGLLSGNYALDRDGRYRAGVNLRWLRDPIGRPHQQWVSFGGEISYSWGR